MNFETLMAIFAGGLFVVVCGLMVYIFVSFKADFNEFRNMLDAKLTQLGHALASIDTDLRGEIHVHDRRLAVLEIKNGNRRQEADK